MTKPRCPLTEQEFKRLHAASKNGYSTYQLSNRFDISLPTIKKYLNMTTDDFMCFHVPGHRFCPKCGQYLMLKKFRLNNRGRPEGSCRDCNNKTQNLNFFKRRYLPENPEIREAILSGPEWNGSDVPLTVSVESHDGMTLYYIIKWQDSSGAYLANKLPVFQKDSQIVKIQNAIKEIQNED